MKDWFFISDAHLSEQDRERQKRLVSFLESNRERMQGLVILGDLFDFWFGFPDYVDPAYRPLCDTLLSLTRKGIRLIYLEGNHDFSMGSFFTEVLHGEVYPREYVLRIDGIRIFLSHGDGLDPWDFRYRLYRFFLKNRAVYFLIRLLGPGWTRRIKNWINGRHWMHRRRFLRETDSPDIRFAREKCDQGMDAVVLGHTHRPCRRKFGGDGKTCYYYNVGDWITHFSYLRYNSLSGFELEYDHSNGFFPGDGKGPPSRDICPRSGGMPVTKGLDDVTL